MSLTDSVRLSNGHLRSSSALSSSSSTSPSARVPPQIEATLSRLSAYRNVRGVMILSRRSATENASSGSGGAIIQSTGTVFDGESGRKYAKALEGVVANVAQAVGDCDEGVSHET